MIGSPRLLAPGVRWTPEELARDTPPPTESKPDRRRRPRGEDGKFEAAPAAAGLSSVRRAGGRLWVRKPKAPEAKPPSHRRPDGPAVSHVKHRHCASLLTNCASCGIVFLAAPSGLDCLS